MVGILIFFIILAILILSHEAGHFFTARWFKIKVEEFGFGFPPRILSKKIGDTTYSLNAFPLGGFVKIYGENGDNQTGVNSFSNKPIWQRSIVLSSGVIANIAVSLVVLTILFTFGMPSAVTPDNEEFIRERELRITEVLQDSPAYLAGLKSGDQIISLRIEDRILQEKTAEAFQVFINDNFTQELNIEVSRFDEQKREEIIFSTQASPRLEILEGQALLGVGLFESGIVVFPWYLSIIESAKTIALGVRDIILAIFQNLRSIIFQEEQEVTITGPVGIVMMTSRVHRLGWAHLGHFLAILSLNLAVINFLPIPALDGGRFVFLIIEKIRGRAIPQKIEALINGIGFVFLLFLIFLVTINDIGRFF